LSLHTQVRSSNTCCRPLDDRSYSERRSYFTKESFFTAQAVTVLLKNPDYGEIAVRGHSLSDLGVSVDFGRHIKPPIGTILEAKFKRHTGAINKRAVPMMVNAEHPDGTFDLVFLN